MAAVYHDGLALVMSDDAMKELGWTDGQAISGDQVWEGIRANARAFCRDMDKLRSAGEPGIPDTNELAAMCGHSPAH